MGSFFSYSLQSALCLSIFYLFYKILLSGETFHRFNRYTLLGIMVLSWLTPFFAMSLPLFSAPNTAMQTSAPASVELIAEDMTIVPEASVQSAFIIIFSLYITGIALYMLYQTISYLRLLRLLRKGRHTVSDNNVRLIIHSDSHIAPFSWMRHIVLSEEDYLEDGNAIIAHETAHIRSHHSWDLIAAQILVALQWFNPAAWLLYRELRIVHEYEADEAVLNEGFEAQHYQLLLIKKAVGTRLYSMANGYNHSNNLKKRITMMLQKKSNSWARLKYTLVLPLAVTTVAALARPEISQSFTEISSVKVNRFASTVQPVEAENVKKTIVAETETVPVAKTTETKTPVSAPTPAMQKDTVVFMVVEEMPKFPGGDKALMAYLSENIRYPINAIKKGISGRVVVSFVVGKDGTLRDFNVVRSVDPELDAEALRVTKAMPKWEPGRQRGKNVSVKYTIPITFNLSSPKDTLKH